MKDYKSLVIERITEYYNNASEESFERFVNSLKHRLLYTAKFKKTKAENPTRKLTYRDKKGESFKESFKDAGGTEIVYHYNWSKRTQENFDNTHETAISYPFNGTTNTLKNYENAQTTGLNEFFNGINSTQDISANATETEIIYHYNGSNATKDKTGSSDIEEINYHFKGIKKDFMRPYHWVFQCYYYTKDDGMVHINIEEAHIPLYQQLYELLEETGGIEQYSHSEK